MPLRVYISILILCSLCLTVRSEIVSAYFTIHKGDSVFEVARDLKESGYIKSRFTFIVPLIWSGKYKKLKAGRYDIESGLNSSQIADLFEKGTTAPVRIDIIPGMTINDISKLLSKANSPQSEDFLKLTLEGDTKIFKQSFLDDKPAGTSLEGYLYPDSYLIESTEPAEVIINSLLNNFERRVSQGTSTPVHYKDKSFYEIVTMASILEKEVQSISDKKKVAGILWKRMEYNLSLQVDSTNDYFLATNKKRVVANDTAIYNTYNHLGLPSGPIANPPLESIMAAANPTPTDYWYYLSTRDGTIVYSKTLGEHLINKATYAE